MMFEKLSFKTKYRYIQGVFLLGAILDGLCTADLMLYTLSGISIYYGYVNIPALRAAADVTCMLMLGWTLALAWGAVEPITRRALLLVVAMFITMDRFFAIFLVGAGFIVITPLFVILQVWFVVFVVILVCAYIMGKPIGVENYAS